MKVRHARAVQLLAEGATVSATARALGVAPRTIRRWRELPEVADRLAEIDAEARDNAWRRGRAQLGKAQTALGDIVSDSQAPPGARVAAARLIGEWAGVSKERPLLPSTDGADPETEDELVDLLASVPPDLLARAMRAGGAAAALLEVLDAAALTAELGRRGWRVRGSNPLLQDDDEDDDPTDGPTGPH